MPFVKARLPKEADPVKCENMGIIRLPDSFLAFSRKDPRMDWWRLCVLCKKRLAFLSILYQEHVQNMLSLSTDSTDHNGYLVYLVLHINLDYFQAERIVGGTGK